MKGRGKPWGKGTDSDSLSATTVTSDGTSEDTSDGASKVTSDGTKSGTPRMYKATEDSWKQRLKRVAETRERLQPSYMNQP